MKARLASLAQRYPFARNVLMLASGTVLGQAVMVLVLPLLTRLYAPSAFGLLGVLMALLAILATPACLRLEIALPLPKDDDDAINLLALALIAATVVAALIAVIVAIAPLYLARLIDQPRLAPYMWMVPLGVWLGAVYSAIQFWSIRKARFGDVASTQIVRAVGGAGTQVGMGLAQWSPFGLLFGQILYTGLGSVGLARLLWRNDRALLSRVTIPDMRRNLHEQRRFPLFSVPESILDSAAVNAPILLIATIAGAAEAGFLLLALRVTSIPVGLIGGSISRVYLADAAERLRAGTLGPFTRGVMLNLLKLGILPFVGLAIVAPLLFPWIFGPDWERAGVMVACLAPYMMLQFIVSPVSTILAALQKQHISLSLQAFGFVLIIGSMLIAGAVAPTWVFYFFAVAATIHNFAYVMVVLALTRMPTQHPVQDS